MYIGFRSMSVVLGIWEMSWNVSLTDKGRLL